MAGKPTKLEVIAGMQAMVVLALDAVLKDRIVAPEELPTLMETRENARKTLAEIERYRLNQWRGFEYFKYGEITARTRLRIVSQERDVERTYGKGRPNLKLVRPAMTPDDAA
jgi:hypothetical protein